MPTTLSRRNPLLDLSEFRSLIEPLFSDVEAQLGVSQRWSPAIDVVRRDKSVQVRADVPGIKPEDVKIEIEHDTLTLSGHVEEKVEKKEGRFIRRERRYGSFARSIALPPNIDREAIDATCKDGVLTIDIPMPPAGKSGDKFEIKPKTG
ncbi:MAG: Hsp20/alpha crystallin family protein [Solirubrobacterales bacterium]